MQEKIEEKKFGVRFDIERGDWRYWVKVDGSVDADRSEEHIKKHTEPYRHAQIDRSAQDTKSPLNKEVFARWRVGRWSARAIKMTFLSRHRHRHNPVGR